MSLWREAIGRPRLVLTSLLFAAPLATAAVVGAAKLLALSPESGYLLYPRSGVCASTRGADEPATGAAAVDRQAPVFRPARNTAGAVMPPELGERLDAEWLESADPKR
jgi:hypothetical protein